MVDFDRNTIYASMKFSEKNNWVSPLCLTTSLPKGQEGRSRHVDLGPESPVIPPGRIVLALSFGLGSFPFSVMLNFHCPVSEQIWEE